MPQPKGHTGNPHGRPRVLGPRRCLTLHLEHPTIAEIDRLRGRVPRETWLRRLIISTLADTL